ncbi:hypothetical protein L600_000700000720 [Isoptericola variabilis J7]|uniref:Rv3235 family protein n=1 Tax=Isoptericola variabilis TaxID=139208 RepID=UPI0011A2994D|nr:Rv3235 family protein [Isoptericola variabilis]TWH26193.1 hypothetical protein L600_000700000720 [Isoptericola variabilis J7]
MTTLTDPAPRPGPATPPTRPTRLRVSAPPGTTGPARRLDVVRPSRVRRVRLGAARTELDHEAVPRPLAPEPAPTLPDPTAQCCSVVRAAVEVLRGERGPGQLARWVTPTVLDQLTERARLARRVRPAASTPSRPVLVRRVRLVRLGEDVAEATVVLDEARRGVWRVAVLELG